VQHFAAPCSFYRAGREQQSGVIVNDGFGVRFNLTGRDFGSRPGDMRQAARRERLAAIESP
jgi:hypothetical protein